MEVLTSSTVVFLPVPLLGIKRNVMQIWIVFQKNEELWLKRVLVWKLKGRFLWKDFGFFFSFSHSQLLSP